MTNGHNGSVGVAFPSGNRLDLLIDQIGILTELVTTGFSELKNGLSEIKIRIVDLIKPNSCVGCVSAA
jgi:hypothetical protein